jgi:hypothetical protein
MIDVAADELLSFDAVAKKLGVKKQTVGLWRRRGLECVRVGGRWYTTPAALNRFSVPSSAAKASAQAEAFRREVREAREELRGYGVGKQCAKRKSKPGKSA